MKQRLIALMKRTVTTLGGLMALAIIVGVFLSGVFIGGVFVSSRAIASRLPATVAAVLPAEKPANIDMSPVWRAWHILDDKFVPANIKSTTTQEAHITDQEKVWGLIQGLAASMNDPYTVFMPPEEAEIFNSDIQGSFEGVGMEISVRDGILTVVSPLKGTPAFRAGIKSNDKIVEIDGTSTKKMSVHTAVKLIRGPKGTDVTFKIAREGESDLLTITVTRDTIDIPTIETKLDKTNGIFTIELMSFSAVSPELFRKAIKEFIAAKVPHLIIDLRGNPGGYLNAAVDMASWFLPEGKVVVTEDYGKKQSPTVHRTHGHQVFKDDFTFVILVDRGSASASEILAGALHDYHKATLIGTRTFGKGSVQELIPITKDTSLKVTVARWLLPKGESITGDGITPDITVELTDKDKKRILDLNDDYDPIMQRAIDFIKKGK